MLRPSYAELMDTMSKNSEKDVTSRYTVVIAASKRARQLIDGDETMADTVVDSNKPVSIAVEEIREGKITVVPEGQGTKLRPKKEDIDEAEIKKELEQKAAKNEEVKDSLEEEDFPEDIEDDIEEEDSFEESEEIAGDEE